MFTHGTIVKYSRIGKVLDMIASYSISAGMVTESELIHTLYNVILRIARNFLETRENVKISTHPFYHTNLD